MPGATGIRQDRRLAMPSIAARQSKQTPIMQRRTAPGHRLTRARSVPLSELDDEPSISPGRQYRLRDQVDAPFAANGVTPRRTAETQNAAAGCAMAAADLGFTISDAVTVGPLEGQVVVRGLRPTVTFSIDVLGSPGHPLSKATPEFLTLVRSDWGSEIRSTARRFYGAVARSGLRSFVVRSAAAVVIVISLER